MFTVQTLCSARWIPKSNTQVSYPYIKNEGWGQPDGLELFSLNAMAHTILTKYNLFKIYSDTKIELHYIIFMLTNMTICASLGLGLHSPYIRNRTAKITKYGISMQNNKQRNIFSDKNVQIDFCCIIKILDITEIVNATINKIFKTTTRYARFVWFFYLWPTSIHKIAIVTIKTADAFLPINNPKKYF